MALRVQQWSTTCPARTRLNTRSLFHVKRLYLRHCARRSVLPPIGCKAFRCKPKITETRVRSEQVRQERGRRYRRRAAPLAVAAAAAQRQTFGLTNGATRKIRTKHLTKSDRFLEHTFRSTLEKSTATKGTLSVKQSIASGRKRRTPKERRTHSERRRRYGANGGDKSGQWRQRAPPHHTAPHRTAPLRAAQWIHCDFYRESRSAKKKKKKRTTTIAAYETSSNRAETPVRQWWWLWWSCGRRRRCRLFVLRTGRVDLMLEQISS